MKRRSRLKQLRSRFTTVRALIAHFLHGQRFFMIPLLLVLLAAGLLLVVTGGLSYIAPFVYALF